MSGEAKERLFFDASRSKLVPEGHPEAAFLAAAVGDPIPDGHTAPKQAAKPADKSVKAAENK